MALPVEAQCQRAPTDGGRQILIKEAIIFSACHFFAYQVSAHLFSAYQGPKIHFCAYGPKSHNRKIHKKLLEKLITKHFQNGISDTGRGAVLL
jgi:hypothetical protein